MQNNTPLTELLTPLLNRLEAADYPNFQDYLSRISLDDLIKLQSACSFILESSINLYTGYQLVQDALKRARTESKYMYPENSKFSKVVNRD